MEEGWIDWSAKEGAVLVNPRLPQHQQELAHELLGRHSPWPDHIWLATSGTHLQSADEAKWVALSKSAFLESAKAVNKHLLSDQYDRWLHALPNCHVAGIAIWARSHLSLSRVFHFEGRWSSERFTQMAWKKEITLTALVPTQLYDLVLDGCTAPPTLRATIVGGGRLSDDLYMRAKSLGWKPLPSYGMTECASQVATAPLESAGRVGDNYKLQPLSHVRLSLNAKGLLEIISPSLLTVYGFVSSKGVRFVDPKDSTGRFTTEDRCGLTNHELLIYGRESEFIKIAGESASLSQLNALLVNIKGEMHLQGEHHLIVVEDKRLGHAIHLTEVDTPKEKLDLLVERYNNNVLPPLRIRKTHHLHYIPKTLLGKVATSELHALCVQG